MGLECEAVLASLTAPWHTGALASNLDPTLIAKSPGALWSPVPALGLGKAAWFLVELGLKPR